MALINTGPDYTRTGENFLTNWGNKLSVIPFGIGAWAAGVLGFAGTAVDTIGWLLRGKVASAATAAAAGTVSTLVNSTGASWWLNIGSGVVSGRSAGTHARALTEGAIGTVTGVLGFQPTVLRSYTAGVGNTGAGNVPTTSRSFTDRIAGERNQNAEQLWAQKMNGEAGAYVSPSLTGQRGIA